MPEKFDRNSIPHAPDLRFELELWAAGVGDVAGVDEAGRGALAGPVSAAALILPPDPDLRQALWGVRDSKQLTPAKRAFWVERLRRLALDCGVGFASNQEIDELGIVPATRLAIQRALQELRRQPQRLLVDYLDLPDCSIPQTSLVKGDARCLSIAGASILAKTARDEILRQLDAQHPGYGFASHKGYGTLAHRQALARLGPSPVHRLSFRVKAAEAAEKAE